MEKLESQSINLYINLEPVYLQSTQSSVELNFNTYFDHLSRAAEGPLIQFLEQIYESVKTAAGEELSVVPRNFQRALRQFVRERPQLLQQQLVEFLKSGKHSFEHLSTIALMACRTLAQSIAAGDYRLVIFSQSQPTAARFTIETDMAYETLFVEAAVEAARQLDHEPTLFSRKVRSKKYMENREKIRNIIQAALRSSINDTALKAFTSLRQHILEQSTQQEKNASVMQQMQFEQNQQAQLQKRASQHDQMDYPSVASSGSSLREKQVFNLSKAHRHGTFPQDQSSPLSSTVQMRPSEDEPFARFEEFDARQPIVTNYNQISRHSSKSNGKAPKWTPGKNLSEMQPSLHMNAELEANAAEPQREKSPQTYLTQVEPEQQMPTQSGRIILEDNATFEEARKEQQKSTKSAGNSESSEASAIRAEKLTIVPEQQEKDIEESVSLPRATAEDLLQ